MLVFSRCEIAGRESDLESPTERKEINERRMKLARGYLAFVAALLVAAVAKSNDYWLAWVVISRLSLSGR